MRTGLLTAFLCLAVVLAACDTRSTVTEPVSASGNAPIDLLVHKASFTEPQLAVVGEMYMLGEDLGLILPAEQVRAIDAVTGIGSGILGDPRTMDSRLGVDMDALIYLNLIIKANPDIDPATIAEIRRLIAENTRLRLAAIKGATDRGALQAELEALHLRLMRQISALLTPAQLARVEALKERIDKQRLEDRLKMDALRVKAQVDLMTRVLGLSERQAAAVRTLLMQQLADIAALQAKYRGQPELLRAALVRLQASYDAQLHKLLGDELWRKWVVFKNRGIISTGGDRG